MANTGDYKFIKYAGAAVVSIAMLAGAAAGGAYFGYNAGKVSEQERVVAIIAQDMNNPPQPKVPERKVQKREGLAEIVGGAFQDLGNAAKDVGNAAGNKACEGYTQARLRALLDQIDNGEEVK